MNRNRKKKNRKKETGAVVSLLLASSLPSADAAQQ